MSIYHAGFDCIVSGKQRIEVRVNDAKRQQVKVGDRLMLTRKPEVDQTLELEVVGLSYFRTFKDLFESIPPEVFGWPAAIKVEEQVRRMHEFCSAAEEERFGVVVIHIRLIARKVLAKQHPE